MYFPPGHMSSSVCRCFSCSLYRWIPYCPYCLRYINFLERQEETGIDYSTDTYDGGLHMNLSVAEKLSVYFGRILSGEMGVPDRRGETELSLSWEEKLAAYEAEKQEQYRYYGMKQ